MVDLLADVRADEAVLAAALEPQDQVTLASADTIDFVWSSSFDVDNDPLEYELNIFGSGLDTTIGSLADTSLEFLSDNILQPGTTYQWTVSVFDGLISVTSPDTFSFTTPVLTQIEDGLDQIPLTFSLKQNYPNPFNPVTTIRYEIPRSAAVKIEVYNIVGQKVAILVDEQKEPGYHNVQWDASQLASGIYLYRIVAADFVRTYRMMLVK